MVGPDVLDNPAFHDVCRAHAEQGIDVRILRMSRLPHADFIVVDNVVIFEAAAVGVTVDDVPKRVHVFDTAWATAVPWP